MIGMGTTIFLVNPVNFGSGATYLLDTYSAAAAYSLRQLKTGVTSVVRVRRSSDSAESDFTADEITDGTLTTWTGANDGFVTKWYDQSGNGKNTSQGTAAKQPKLVASGSVILENTKPTIQFDGTDDTLGRSVGGGITGTLLNTILTVCNITNTNARVFTINDVSSPLRNTLGDNMTISGTSDKTIVGSASSRGQSFYEVYGNNTITAYYDNTSAGSGTIGSYKDGTIFIGTDITQVVPMSGNVQELILMNTDESANRTDIESDINTHYSIY